MSKMLKIFFVVLIFLVLGSKFSPWSSRPYGVGSSSDGERVAQIAIDKKDVSICDQMYTTGFGDFTLDDIRANCYQSFATVYPKNSVCPNLLIGASSKDSVKWTPSSTSNCNTSSKIEE